MDNTNQPAGPPSPVQDPKDSQNLAPTGASLEQLEQAANATPKTKEKKSFSVGDTVKGLTKGTNVYLLAFGIIVLLAGLVSYIALSQDSSKTSISIEDNELTDDIIDDLLANETRVGDVTQTLTVEANTIFSGKILVKDSLDVAGSINVGGPLTLPGITVSGSSTFDDVEVGNNLSILGNASVQGTLSVQNGISVIGNGTFSGILSAASINADSLEISGDLIISRHLDTRGTTPTISSGEDIGNGGTVSISGTDTAGTITINTGSNPSTGLLASITFRVKFNATPHVIFSAVNQDAGTIDTYVVRSTGGFTFRTTSTPDASTTYVFDYFAIE